MQLEQIRLMNDATILYLEKMKINSERNILIKNILKDDACFFKLDKQDAYSILEDIGVEKNIIASVYLELISSKQYYYLQQTGKIEDSDEEIKIKYKKYNPMELFDNKDIKEQSNISNETKYISTQTKDKNIIKNIFNKIISWFKK